MSKKKISTEKQRLVEELREEIFHKNALCRITTSSATWSWCRCC